MYGTEPKTQVDNANPCDPQMLSPVPVGNPSHVNANLSRSIASNMFPNEVNSVRQIFRDRVIDGDKFCGGNGFLGGNQFLAPTAVPATNILAVATNFAATPTNFAVAV